MLHRTFGHGLGLDIRRTFGHSIVLMLRGTFGHGLGFMLRGTFGHCIGLMLRRTFAHGLGLELRRSFGSFATRALSLCWLDLMIGNGYLLGHFDEGALFFRRLFCTLCCARRLLHDAMAVTVDHALGHALRLLWRLLHALAPDRDYP